MARRRPPAPLALDDGDTVPAELLGRLPSAPHEVDHWVGLDERAPEDFGFPDWFWRIAEAARRKRAAAQQWCEDRGYSHAMTFLGWPHPSPDEHAAGHVTTPPGGPVRHRRDRRA